MSRCHLLPWFVALPALVAVARPAADSGQASADGIRATISAAFGQLALAPAPTDSLGASLADYARRPAGDPVRCENFAEAARRILSRGTTERLTPETTARWLEEAASGLRRETSSPEDRLAGHLARFHSRRALAAVHYNLFLRGLRLPELVAATLAEKTAVDAWRDLAREREPSATPGPWHAELKRLEAGLRELEEQCCPPDPKTLQEKIWIPEPGPAAGRLPIRKAEAGRTR